jgi:DNA polymerase-3 subunit epsilon
LNVPRFNDHVDNVIDTLVQAKEMHPGKRNSLDALCDRYGISNAHRALHGALLDAELLAEVYLAMTRGQNSLTIDLGAADGEAGGLDGMPLAALAEIIVLVATAEELVQHDAALARLDKDVRGTCIWHTVLQPL